MQNNDLFSDNYSGSKNISPEPPRAGDQNSHFQSMQSIRSNTPSFTESAVHALKFVLIVIVCIAVVMGTLAKLTHGKALFYDKVEGEVIESEIVFYRHLLARNYSRCHVKIKFTYKGEEYTINRSCSAQKLVGDKVFVYVSMFDHSNVIYYDPVSVSFLAVPAVIMALFILYKKFGDSIYTPPALRFWE